MPKTRSQPSHYPPLAFHAIRICALLSSLVVASTLAFFVYQLKHDGYKIPWTFFVLLSVALLTLITLTFTFVLHVCHVLSPIFNLIINIALSILWLFGLSLLGWNMAGTLGHVCNAANWGSEAGIMICRIYKALFTFSLLATIATVGMAILDIKVRRRQTSLGKYNPMRDSAYDPKPSKEPYRNSGLERHHEEPSEPWRADHEPSDYHSRGLSRETISTAQFGYTTPSEQTHYDAGNYGSRERY